MTEFGRIPRTPGFHILKPQTADLLDCRNARRQVSLLAETRLHGYPLAPFGAAAGKHLLAALGLHAHAKPMFFASLAPVRLERTLRHERLLLLIASTFLGQILSINDGLASGKGNAAANRRNAWSMSVMGI
jgi:hypothetical protein